MKEILTPNEAGLYLNLHVRTISRLAKKGLIPALKVGRRWRFRKAALEEWFFCRKITPNKNEVSV
jgi:excisionase family DNA binding protein